MIFLIVLVTFFSSTGKQPAAAIIRAPSAVACEAKAVEQRAIANKDPEVEGYTFTCITVPTKS
jgi:hypothetical protein